MSIEPTTLISRVGFPVRWPLRKRLWMTAYSLAVFLGILCVGNTFEPPGRNVTARMLGLDFIAFYTGGSFVRQGRLDQIYNLDSVRTFQHDLVAREQLELGPNFGPFWNPPFYAWVFAPLSALQYRTAFGLWTCFSLAALAAALVLMIRMLPRYGGLLGERKMDWRDWGLVPALVLVSMPCIQALSHGQNTFSSLLLLTLVVAAWRAGKAIPAGLAVGLLFYKPQLAAVLAVILVLNLGRRALLGIAISGVTLLLINVLTLPGTLTDYLHRLPLNVHYMQVENVYLWERHVTLKALWRLLLQGRGPGEASGMVKALTVASCTIIGGGLLASAVRFRKATGLRRDRTIAATIACMPLLMPFYFDYDLLLLSVPAVLFVGELVLRDSDKPLRVADKWLIRAWAVCFACLFINPGIAAKTHVNLTVIFVTAVAALLVHRAWRREASQSASGRAASPLAPRQAA